MLVVLENPNALRYEDVIIKTIKENTTQTVVQTPCKRGASFDGFFAKENRITSIFEAKYWRPTPYKDENLKKEGWFIDKHKLENLTIACKLLCVPAYLFCGYGEVVYVFKPVDDFGRVTIPVSEKQKMLPITTMGSNTDRILRNVVCISLQYIVRTLNVTK